LTAAVVHRQKRIIPILVRRGAETAGQLRRARNGLAGAYEEVFDRLGYQEIVELLQGGDKTEYTWVHRNRLTRATDRPQRRSASAAPNRLQRDYMRRLPVTWAELWALHPAAVHRGRILRGRKQSKIRRTLIAD
jgi:hypothetical protein